MGRMAIHECQIDLGHRTLCPGIYPFRTVSGQTILWDIIKNKIMNAKLLAYVGFRIASFNGRNTDLFAVKAAKSPIDRTLILY